MSKNKILQRIAMCMGGRAAEFLTQNDISTGAYGDLQHATELARSMVTRYGMSEKLGPVVYGKDNDQVFLGMDYNHTKNYSDSYATQIDDEIKNIVIDCENKCREILEEHKDKLVLVAETLINKEKIHKDLFIKLMDENYSPDEEAETVEDVVEKIEIVEETETTLTAEETIETEETTEE